VFLLPEGQKKENYLSIIEQMKLQLTEVTVTSPSQIYKLAVDHLAKLSHFHWTGIYLLDSNANELILEYYVGKPTDHTKIPVGKGICGSAVAEKIDKIIADVREENNYLACSLETRSEIVVLIEDEDRIIGQIDVDSDNVAAFDEIDRNYLRKISEIIVKKLKTI
jgi:GAF domain-containing protein